MNKKHALGIIVVVLIVSGAIGLSTTGEKNTVNEYIEFPISYVEEVDFGLDEQNTTFLENRISEYQKELDREDITETDKINYLVAQAFDYRSLGDYVSMDVVIAEAVGLASDSQAVLKTYSEMLYVQERYQESLDVIESAIAIDPSAYLPWLWRAELEINLLIDPLGAENVFEQALSATSYDVDVLIAYAEFLERQDKIEGAVSVWEDAIERYPDREEAFLERIDLLK